MIYLDTHVIAWLYAGKIELIPEKIQEEISTQEILISPVVALELQYLFEIGRVTEPGKAVVDDLIYRIGLTICDLPFQDVIKTALSQDWTRDPFDRIIVAQAGVRQSKLITKDAGIHQHYDHAIW